MLSIIFTTILSVIALSVVAALVGTIIYAVKVMREPTLEERINHAKSGFNTRPVVSARH